MSGRRDPLSFAGRVEVRVFESELLAGNPAGEPHVRELPVYLPPDASSNGSHRYPTIFLLSAFTSRAHELLDTHPWHCGPVAQFDRLVASGEAPPAILVLPDCWTRLGGSQYVDSAWHGPFEQYVARELVPFVDAAFPTRPGRRAVAGKSSGGFGALHLGMTHPDLFPAIASISGDCDFELCFGSEILSAMRALVAYDMDPPRFLEAFEREPRLDGDAHAILNVLAMSACYSPNPQSPLGYDLPMDLRTGERIDAVWSRWLAFDPLHRVRERADALRSLELLHLECGLRDEFHLQWGLRRLVDVLRELEVEHHHEEHLGGHRGLGSRWPAVLTKLARHLSA